jgi:hypothetical protein
VIKIIKMKVLNLDGIHFCMRCVPSISCLVRGVSCSFSLSISS